ncbi:KR domain-containing protein, partial [Usnea florida]
SAADFRAAIIPKVQGAQSLDRAFQGINLDYFVMTSSISATLGDPGQCNYGAANSFLDSLARQRNVRHQAGTSLVLPMILDVGVVSENENIEASLSRKGMYSINKQEILRGFQIAISQPAPRPDQPIMLGLEPSKLAKAIAASETVDVYWYNDAHFKKTLKAASADSFGAAVEAIGQHIMKRGSRILMLPMESFEMEGAAIAEYGLDCVIGAELRTWLFMELGVDMPFPVSTATLAGLDVQKLSMIVAEGMGVLASQT